MKANGIKTMSHYRFQGFLFVKTALASLVFFCTTAQVKSEQKAAPVSFSRDVAPILALKCQGCHHAQKLSMGLDLTSYAQLRKGGKQSGPNEIIIPGKPDESRLVEVLLADAEPRMPLKLKPLTDQEIGIFKKWIEQGAICDAPTPETRLVDLVSPDKALAAAQASARVESATRPVVAFLNNGQKLAIAEHGFVNLFDLQKNNKPLLRFGPTPGRIQDIWADPASTFLIIASGRPGLDGLVTRWDIPSQKKVFETKIHTDQILSLAVSADMGLIATGSYDKSIALTDLKTGSIIKRLAEHTDAVYAVAFGPAADQRLVSVSGDRTMKLWDLKSGKRLETMSESTAELYAAAISADGRIGYSGGVDRTIRAYDLKAQPPRLIQSALAHEGPITSLQWAPRLASTSEDRSVRFWDAATLKQSSGIMKYNDWPTSLSAAGSRLAVGQFDGSVAVYETGPKENKIVWQKPAGSARGGTPDSFKPQLFRQATLGTPSPRIVVAGRETVMTLSGLGLDQASQVTVVPGDITAEIIAPKEPKPNTIQVRVKIPPRLHFELASLRFATPLGITPEQSFGITPAELKMIESAGNKITEVKAGDLLQATLNAPGDIARARISLKAGELLTVSLLARRLGSALSPQLQLKDEQGRTLARNSGPMGRDPLVSYQAAQPMRLVLEVSDSQFTGSANHFAYLQLDHSQVSADHWPDARSALKATPIQWASASQAQARTEMPVVNGQTQIAVQPLPIPAGWVQENGHSILAIPGDVHVATEKSPTLKVNDAGVGRFTRKSEIHEFQFAARKGQRMIVETYARRLGRNVDTAIEITDEKSQPVTNVTLRKVADTLIAFRDHASTIKGIRLTQWPDFQMGNYVLINREVARIFQLPRNPDDDCQFWGDEQRWGFFGTTPEQHPMARTVTRVEIVPPGQEGSIDPNLLVKIPYANDDSGVTYGNDSYIDFTAPADGIYRVRVRETQGHFGPGVSYAITIREPKPDFSWSVSPMDWSIPAGGSRLITATIRRLDGFDGPVSIAIENLPSGWKSTPATIEAGQMSADLLVEVPNQIPADLKSAANWKMRATARIGGTDVAKEISGAGRGWVVTPKSNLRMTPAQSRVEIRPGGISTLKLKAERAEAFKGRIPIDVRNLPYGVRVLDIGLNGVLITERETERVIRIYAEPWVKPQVRPFYAVGKAESAGTSDSTPPVMLEVLPAEGQGQSQPLSLVK